MRNLQKGNPERTAILADVVSRITYKNWNLELAECSRGQGCEGLTLRISATVPNAVAEGEVEFLHLMPVIPAAYDETSWTRWVLEQILLVEKHECMEFFRKDGEQVYFPAHGPGDDPYAMVEIRTFEQAHAESTPYIGGPPQDPHFQS
jgi:hypothetical protein